MIEYYFVLLIDKVISRLKKQKVYFIAKTLGLFMYYFIPIRKKMMYSNIKRVFNNYGTVDINKIIKNNYIKISKSAFEYFMIKNINKNNYSEYAYLENINVIDEEIKKNRGIILLGAHFDNPELVTNIIRIATGYNLAALVKKQQNPFINSLFEKIRKTHSIELIYKGASIKEVFRILRKKKILATVADISVSLNEGILLDFFDTATPTPIGPAKFAIRTDSAVIPVFSYRLSDDTHKIKIFPKINWEEFGGTEEDKINFVMQTYNNLLAENIIKNPDEWFWMHNRWKFAV